MDIIIAISTVDKGGGGGAVLLKSCLVIVSDDNVEPTNMLTSRLHSTQIHN
jgi:hypothetical protein